MTKKLSTVLSGAATLTPVASTSVIGGVIVDGTTITINNGVISGASAIVPSVLTPAVNSGTGATGSSTGYSRGDHVHPIDTSRAPLASPTFTGTSTIVGFKETKVAMAANDIDLSSGTFFTKTISTATTLTVSNIASSGFTNSFILDLTNGGTAIVTWWSNLKWAGGTAPTLTSTGRDSLGFYTYDAGVTWTGVVLGKDIK